MRITAYALLLLPLLPAVAVAQAETGGFTLMHDQDTIATERFERTPERLQGTLVRLIGENLRERVKYDATLLPDASAPLLQFSAWKADDPEEMPARQVGRIIFKDDSVAIDEATPLGGASTRVLGTRRSALAYLNLSTALLEQATRRARGSSGAPVALAFFSLDGGQTALGAVRRIGPDSSAITIGNVEFRLRVDPDGRILGGAVPSQRLLILRDSTP
jgi:hypothetical protein